MESSEQSCVLRQNPPATHSVTSHWLGRHSDNSPDSSDNTHHHYQACKTQQPLVDEETAVDTHTYTHRLAHYREHVREPVLCQWGSVETAVGQWLCCSPLHTHAHSTAALWFHIGIPPLHLHSKAPEQPAPSLPFSHENPLLTSFTMRCILHYTRRDAQAQVCTSAFFPPANK